MLARVAWGKVKPGTWQEYEQVYHDAILPDTRPVRGLVFRELLQGIDDPNEGISLTLWERREDLDAYEQSALYTKEFAPALQPFFVGDYKTYRCDVKYMQ